MRRVNLLNVGYFPGRDCRLCLAIVGTVSHKDHSFTLHVVRGCLWLALCHVDLEAVRLQN